MALTVPRKDVPEVQATGIPSVRQQIDTPAMAFGDGGAAMRQGSQALATLSDMANKRAMDEMETQAAARSLELSNLARRELNKFIYDPENGLLTRKGGAAQSARADTEAFLGDLRQRYTNMDGESPRVREMLQKEMAGIFDSGMDLADRHQFTELSTFRDEQLRSRVTTNMETQALNFTDESQFNRIQADTRDAIMTQARVNGWSPEKTQLELNKAISTARSAQFTAMINQDKPDSTMLAYQAFQEARRKGQIGFEESMKLDSMFDAAMPKAAAQVAMTQLRGGVVSGNLPTEFGRFLVNQLEGGSQVVEDGAGAVAKYGFNSRWHDNVQGLTENQAIQKFQTEYWDKIVTPDMSPQFAIIAADAFFNQDQSEVKQMIEQARGNPARLLQLRLDHYRRLAESDPDKYGQNLRGWENRLKSLQEYVSGVSTAPVSAEQVNAAAAQLDLQYAGAGSELIALYGRENKALEDARKAEKQEFMNQIMPVMYANNGDWTQLTPAQQEQAKRIGVWEEITKFTGVSDPNVKVELFSMPPDKLAMTDLSQYQTRLSQEDYLSFVQKQRDFTDKANAEGYRSIQDRIKAAADSMRLTRVNGDPVKLALFYSRAEDSLEAARHANNDKPLTRQQENQVLQSLMLDTSAGVKAYQLQPNQAADIGGFNREDAAAASMALTYLGYDITADNVGSYSQSPARFLGISGTDFEVRKAIHELTLGGFTSLSSAQVQQYVNERRYGPPAPVPQQPPRRTLNDAFDDYKNRHSFSFLED